jgi:hypothetical protein
MIFSIQCGLIDKAKHALYVSIITRICTLRQRNRVTTVFILIGQDLVVDNFNILFTEFTWCIMTSIIIKQCVGLRIDLYSYFIEMVYSVTRVLQIHLVVLKVCDNYI